MVLRNNLPALFVLALFCFAACSKKGTLPIGDPCGEDGSCLSGFCYTGTCMKPGADNDNDGLTNLFEAQLGSNPNAEDSDNDGKLDPTELGPNFVLLDWDGDGLGDIIESDDLDPDGDCITNEFDPQNNVSGFDEEKQIVRLCPLTGVCGEGSGALFISCADTALTCDASEVVGYEEHELSCDGLDNDCDGATDEKLNGNFGAELTWGMGHNWQLRRDAAIGYRDSNGESHLLVFGGEVPTFNLEDPTAPGGPIVTGELWQIEPSTGKAELLEINGDSPAARSGARFGSNSEMNGLVLLGGRANSTPSANQQEVYPGDLWFLNLDTYSWTKVDMPQGSNGLDLEGIAAFPIGDDQSLSQDVITSFYLFGGHNATEVSDRVYRLEIDDSNGTSSLSATIVEIGGLPKALTQASAMLVEGGSRLLLVGGKDENDAPAGIVALDFDDLQNDLVTEVSGVENAGALNNVSGAAVTKGSNVDGELVVAFGGVDSTGTIQSKVYVRQNSAWAEHDLETSFGRTKATGLTLADGSIVFMGGLNDAGEPDVSIEVTVPSLDKPEVEASLVLDQWLIAGAGSSTARSPEPTESLLFPGLLPGFNSPYTIGSYWDVSGSEGTAKVVRRESTLNGKPMSSNQYLSFSSSTFGPSDKKVYTYGFEVDLVNGDPLNQFSDYGLFELNLVSGDWTKTLESQSGPGRLNGAEVVYDLANGLVFVVGGVQVSTTGSVTPSPTIWTLDPVEGIQTQVYGQTPSFSALPWGIVSTWHNEASRTLVLAIDRGQGDYALGVFHMDDYTYEDIQLSTSLPANIGIPVRLSILDTGHQALMLYPDENDAPLARYLHADFNSITDSAHPLSSIDKFRNNGTYFFSNNLDAGLYVGGMYMDDGRVPTRGLMVDLNCLF